MLAAKDCKAEDGYPEDGGRFVIEVSSTPGRYYVFECAIEGAHAVNARLKLSEGGWGDPLKFGERDGTRVLMVFSSSEMENLGVADSAEQGRDGYKFAGCFMHVFEEK